MSDVPVTFPQPLLDAVGDMSAPADLKGRPASPGPGKRGARGYVPPMASRKQSPRISGRFRVTHSDLWDRESLDLLGPAFITFGKDGLGEFRVIAVQGDLDARPSTREGRPAVEFSWEGTEEFDDVGGRGWAVLDENGELSGHLFFHGGDDSAFRAKPEAEQQPSRATRHGAQPSRRPRK